MNEPKARSPRPSGQAPPPAGGFEKIIKAAVDRGASDLHIKAGDVFRARIDGKLIPLTKQRLTPGQTRAIALRLIPNGEAQARIDQLRDYDCSWGMPGVGRFRVNILRQRSSFMVVMRVIPFDVPSFDSLKLPAILRTVAATEHGLVLITGPAGSGKSSTMAALVHQINETQHRHIVTLESPIEFLHRDINSSVTQREIGVDTDNYESGLHAALRQDPDVILIGAMREAAVVDTALKAAETGHLVISALDTPDAATTVARVIDTLPVAEQEGASTRLAESLQAIVSQRLVPRADGQGRAAVVEVLICTGTAREMIRFARGNPDLQEYIRTSRERYGMQTFDQHLVDLVTEGVITHEVAIASSSHATEVEQQIRSVRRRTPAPPPDPRTSHVAPIPDDLSSILPEQ